MESTNYNSINEMLPAATQQVIGEHFETFLLLDGDPSRIEDIKDTLFRASLVICRCKVMLDDDPAANICEIDLNHLEQVHDFLTNSQVVLRNFAKRQPAI